MTRPFKLWLDRSNCNQRVFATIKNEYFSTTFFCCASGNPCQVEKFEVRRAPIIQWRSYTCQVNFSKCFWIKVYQVQKFKFDWFCEILYNYYIDEKETEMTDREFFQLDQQQWFEDFVDDEVSKILADMDIPEEILTCSWIPNPV